MNQPMQFVRTAAPEEQARANFYSLLSRLFYAPPDATLREAAQTMRELDSGVLPIGEDDRLVGILTDRDITVRATRRGQGS